MAVLRKDTNIPDAVQKGVKKKLLGSLYLSYGVLSLSQKFVNLF